MANIRAKIGYSQRTERKPFMYANRPENDFVPLAPVEVEFLDARETETSLDVEGFTLVSHKSALSDLTDERAVETRHFREVADMLTALLGCDHIEMIPRGFMRWSERHPPNGRAASNDPARYVHVDMDAPTAAMARRNIAPASSVARSAQFNVWRALSDPPQDVPLGLCDHSSLQEGDLLPCRALIDPMDGSPEWGFDNHLLAHNPAHRWYWFPNLTADEAIIFKASESDPARAQLVPHGAFDNPLAGQDAPPRVSLEMRATCFWFA